jgi:hypothetical protein
MESAQLPEIARILGPAGYVLAAVTALAVFRLATLGARLALACPPDGDVEAAETPSKDGNSWRQTILTGVFSMSRYLSPRSLFAASASSECRLTFFQEFGKQKSPDCSHISNRRAPDRNDICLASESFCDLLDWASQDDEMGDDLLV